jgi:hypothetical protein
MITKLLIEKGIMQRIKLRLFSFNKDLELLITDIINEYQFKSSINEISFVYMNDVSIESILKTRQIINKYTSNIIVFSDCIEVAQFAWDINAMFFINLSRNNWEQQLIRAIKTVESKNKLLKLSTISFKSQNQTDIIVANEINFILAKANYSLINHKDNKKLLVTKQIGKIEKMLDAYPEIIRIGKSTIINLNKLTKINENKVRFKDGQTINFPENSKNIKLIKKHLFWQ